MTVAADTAAKKAPATGLFPSPAEVEAQTPAGRDRAIDVIRIASLVGVVFGHTIMATSTIRDDVFIWSNLLTESTVFQALTWVFQIMPLFFFAGVAASVQSWNPGSSWGGWLLKRCTRLYRPVFYYLAFWTVALAGLRLVLPEHVYEPIAGISIQLLWFLGAYVLVLAAVPLLARITTTRQVTGAIVGTYAFIAAIDAIRINIDGYASLGYLNTVVWLIPGVFGVAYRRHLLTSAAALKVGLGMLGVNLALLCFGPYELSLVGIETQHLKNMTPPSLLLAGHAIMMCAFAIAAAPAINRWAQRPRVWWLTAIGNSGAMTLYLWHMPLLLGLHLVFDYLGADRYDPSAPGFVALSLLQLALMAGMVAIAFTVLRPLENNPLPLWDGGVVTRTGPRSAAIGLLVCVAGAATLTSVAWGLKDQGVYCVVVMVAALVAARALADD
ncbi:MULTISPECIES: acyltransferase family protein [Mycolicibacterium]|uniref:Acyltransferase n=1 Tax=Mycolicibacterium senegalense TaxID=1796 RepID=A0ABR5G1X2_9MYCO|nr:MULTISPECIES: acyltransferase [Mycolicibacterium]KLI05857.1 acyltransferase [Mycolicibacterium senegalense]KLO54204.1 acyltransferase [Mycolicibacterium senegalense]OBJ96334.1 acyltransferase [Mycolicibacterium conceptionense]OMB84441.1 acyltransferase [Mycolicibacterium conceptionense]OMB99190.1 acyltransferase [Mycolicibacterium conceptionense]